MKLFLKSKNVNVGMCVVYAALPSGKKSLELVLGVVCDGSVILVYCLLC